MQEAAEQPALHFEQATVAEPVTELRVGYFMRKPSFECGDEALAAFVAEIHATRGTDEICRPDLAIVDGLDYGGIGDQ